MALDSIRASRLYRNKQNRRFRSLCLRRGAVMSTDATIITGFPSFDPTGRFSTQTSYFLFITRLEIKWSNLL